MQCKVAIEQKPGYLHAIVTGSNNRENVLRYFEDIRRECEARSCRRVLVEERLEGPRLDTTTVFELASAMSRRYQGFFEAFAFVDVNAESDSNMAFAETVALNRGASGRVFRTVAGAEKWLAGLAPLPPRMK